MKEFHAHVSAIREFYDKITFRVDGNRPAPAIFADIQTRLNRL